MSLSLGFRGLGSGLGGLASDSSHAGFFLLAVLSFGILCVNMGPPIQSLD